ncbi:IgGFc-binding protein-like, partial [Patella vulgata]|uniref:IgGFc-binding protein-like n=1 Tax=Patella vulgata TaxID=6465 RepID=UPI0024A96969
LSSDSFLVLPVDALGSDYYLLTWKSKATFKIIGVVDNTSITIMLPTDVSLVVDGVAFNDSFTVQLNRFQTFTFLNESSEIDLTGLHIITNQPVSIVSGSKRVSIDGTSSDHLVEQMLPVESWGKTFITIPPYNDRGDPAMVIVPSIEHYFVNYSFATPKTYDGSSTRI